LRTVEIAADIANNRLAKNTLFLKMVKCDLYAILRQKNADYQKHSVMYVRAMYSRASPIFRTQGASRADAPP